MTAQSDITAKARHYQRRIDAALRRSAMARTSCLSRKARELRAIRSARFTTASEVADWFGWNGELVRSELRSWGAAA